jgi:hypothetical protein
MMLSQRPAVPFQPNAPRRIAEAQRQEEQQALHNLLDLPGK